MKYYFKLVPAQLGAILILCGMAIGAYSSQEEVSKQVETDSQLTILLYHHIDDTTPPITSTKPELFRQHLEYLKQHNFNIVALDSALERLFTGKPLPPKAVAITFDDGYQSIYKTAWPILDKYQFPFTVFVATEPVEKSYALMMNWQQLKELNKAGVAIANHTHSHAHLLGLTPTQVINDINEADRLLDKHITTHEKQLFAYPYGEYSSSIAQQLKQQTRYAVAQISGPVSIFSDPQALPRFSFSGVFASMEQFKLKLNTLAMPVKNQSQYNPLVAKKTNTFQLTMDSVPFPRPSFTCFYQNQTIDNISWTDNQVSIRLNQPLSDGRSRINCTAPANSDQYYWHSIPIFVAPENGPWPD